MSTVLAKLIVVEGCDGIGKTMIAEYLAKSLAFKYVKFSNPPSQDFARKQYIGFLSLQKRNSVLDRSWLGEFAYAPVFRGYTPEYLDELDELIRRFHDVLYILVDAPQSWAMLHYKDKGVPPYSNKDIIGDRTVYNRLRTGFIKTLNAARAGNKLVINPANYDSAINELIYIEKMVRGWLTDQNFYQRCEPMYAMTCYNPVQRFALGDMAVDHTCRCGHFKDHKLYPFWKKWRWITWGIGNVLDPKVIFVGEAPGMHGCGTTGIPFYFDRSGFYLRWLLFKRGIAETEYYMTNISKCTPKDNKINLEYANICAKLHLHRELHELPETPIVALGRTASNWLNENGYEHKFLYHPAYAIRGGITEADYTAQFNKVVEEFGL